MGIIDDAQKKATDINEHLDKRVDKAIDTAANAVKASTGQYTGLAVAGAALVIIIILAWIFFF